MVYSKKRFAHRLTVLPIFLFTLFSNAILLYASPAVSQSQTESAAGLESATKNATQNLALDPTLSLAKPALNQLDASSV